MQDLSSGAWIACSQIAGVPILRTISSFGTLQTGAGMPDGTLQFTAVVGEKATLWEDNQICFDDPERDFTRCAC